MAQLDRNGVIVEGGEQRVEIRLRLCRMFEAWGKLREQGTDLARTGQRVHARSECVDLAGIRQLSTLVGELPEEFERKLETLGGAIDPALGHARLRLTVERRIDLDRIEVLGVVGKLVEFPRRAVPACRTRSDRGIEQPVPCSAARRIVPA